MVVCCLIRNPVARRRRIDSASALLTRSGLGPQQGTFLLSWIQRGLTAIKPLGTSALKLEGFTWRTATLRSPENTWKPGIATGTGEKATAGLPQ